jgi:succinylglutamate desuccinylase
MNRIICERHGDSNDVLLVLIGALHGNEIEGIKAIKNIVSTIDEHQLKLNGKLVGIAGNIRAIKAKRRFLSSDLNRLWNPAYINKIKDQDPVTLTEEEEEALELLDLLEDLAELPYKRKVLIDLHTTSADNGNFLVYPGESINDPIVQSLKLPVVVNLERYIQGTLMLFSRSLGFNSIVFEGGLIGSEKAIELHTYGLWQVLTSSELVDEPHDIGLHIHYEELIGSLNAQMPKTVRVLHRHEIKPRDYFHMKPGFENFQRVERGELLAEDKRGLIHSPVDGFIFMPLYQNTGNDGFFIVEEV